MEIFHINKDNFEKEVLNEANTVLIDFWAPWCQPCRILATVIDELSQEITNTKICKINIDEQSELAQRFQVKSIPTLIVMKNGKVMNTAVGLQPKANILKLLNQ